MKDVFAAGAISLAFLAQAVSTASAQQPSQTDLRMQKVLQSMQEAISPAAEPRAPVARTGRVKVTVTFTKKQAFTTPARCEVTVQQFNMSTISYSTASRSIPVPFTAATQACVIIVDYDWPDADNSPASPVSIILSLSNVTANPPANAILINRTWSKSIPLPANGATTNINWGDLDI